MQAPSLSWGSFGHGGLLLTLKHQWCSPMPSHATNPTWPTPASNFHPCQETIPFPKGSKPFRSLLGISANPSSPLGWLKLHPKAPPPNPKGSAVDTELFSPGPSMATASPFWIPNAAQRQMVRGWVMFVLLTLSLCPTGPLGLFSLLVQLGGKKGHPGQTIPLTSFSTVFKAPDQKTQMVLNVHEQPLNSGLLLCSLN